MARTLAYTVLLTADDGSLHRFDAGTVPPNWAAEEITNPRAWGDDPDADSDVPDPDHPLALGGPGLSKVAEIAEWIGVDVDRAAVALAWETREDGGENRKGIVDKALALISGTGNSTSDDPDADN